MHRLQEGQPFSGGRTDQNRNRALKPGDGELQVLFTGTQDCMQLEVLHYPKDLLFVFPLEEWTSS